MIAIGAQSRGKDLLEIQVAKKYFAQAQQMAFLGMLESPSLSMVKLFLLMAMYMLGACRRNTAFMYLAIASKSATILGLHVPYQHSWVSSEERAARRRIWMSSRVLDLLCSAILARPSSTPSIERDEYEIDSSNPEDLDHRTLALYATYESSSIIETIVKKFAKSSSVDIQSADTYLQMLREWSHALPSALRNVPGPASESDYGESAHLMVELCYEAYLSDILLGNMCILKAWIFSAGLVLGFSLLVESKIPTHINECFDHSCILLKKLARLSPQAEQYHDILCRFRTAIDLYRQQFLKALQENNNKYVEKIMTIGSFNRAPREGNSSTELQSQLQLVPTTEQPIFEELEGQGCFAETYATDFFGLENEIQMYDAQIGYDTGVAADLRWLCYAAGPS
ncbi:hypothetical protein EYC80_005766 [Monilinia laxa]|nr:hypothetical protein EYC80_005766 [Monilinia laxa]